MTLPMVVPDPALPVRVRIWEVGPRDGLQNESTVLDTAIKVEFIDRLARAGLGVVEATSFVRADRVPQLADAREVMAGIARRDDVRYPALVPNLRGLESAIDAGVSDIAIFASATESFAQRNLGRGYDAQWEMFEPVTMRARAEGLRVRGYLSMCFGDPWEGAVPAEQVVTAALRLLDLGCDAISLGDTIGVATPGQIWRVLDDRVSAEMRQPERHFDFLEILVQRAAEPADALFHLDLQARAFAHQMFHHTPRRGEG